MSCRILGIFASEKQFLLRNLAEKFSSSRHFASGSSISDFLNGSLLGGTSPNANYKIDRGVATIE